MEAGNFDVAIVGGGVIGSAIAYFLMAKPAFGGTVLVVEKGPRPNRPRRSLLGLFDNNSPLKKI